MKKIKYICALILLLLFFDSRSQYVDFSGVFDGTTYDPAENMFEFPIEAESWAGFANNNTSLYPFNFPQGGSITFLASVPQGDSVNVNFRFERLAYPDVDPSFNTSNVLITGSTQKKYTVNFPAQGADNTYSSLLMYLMERDRTLIIKEVVVSQSVNPMAGDWTMAPMAGAFAVGPSNTDFSWWSNTDSDVSTRACYFDDIYKFSSGERSINWAGQVIWKGTYDITLGGSTWVETWQGVDPEACGTPLAPHDGSDATFTYEVNIDAGTVTLKGEGAYFGLAKVYNGGELDGESEVPNAITYSHVVDTNDADSLSTFQIDIGIGFWQFILAKNNQATSWWEYNPNVSFSIDNDPIPEGHDVMITAELETVASSAVLVSFNPSGSAVFNSDYELSNSATNLEIFIPAGEKNGSLIIKVNTDDEIEEDEAIILTPTGYGATLVSGDDIIITIKDFIGNDTSSLAYQALIALYESTDGANWERPWELNTPFLDWEGVESKCLNDPEFEGSYVYETTKMIAAEDMETSITGNVDIKIMEDGSLDFSDWSFGWYQNFYGCCVANGDFSMSTCNGELEINGSVDEYGDTWTFEHNIDGDELTIVWVNVTYAEETESGTTVITIPNLAAKISDRRYIVTELFLDYNNLQGSLPSELGNLKDLQILHLSNNKLNNEGLAVLDSLTNIRSLDLSDNLFSGAVSSSEFFNVKRLNLSGNEFIGDIPKLEGSYADYYDISDNNFTGSIPRNFVNQNYRTLDFSGNEGLTGSIPFEIANLDDLRFFKFDGTNLCEPADENYQNWKNRIQVREDGMYLGNDLICKLPSINLSVDFSSISNGDSAIVSATLSEVAYRDTKISLVPSGTAQLGIDYDLLGGIQTVLGDPVTVIDTTRFPSDSTGTYIWGMAIDSDGNIYVSDNGSSVTKYAPGEAIGEIVAGGNGMGSNLNQLMGSKGIALDSEGNLYVAERFNNRVTKWVPGASEGVVVAGGYGADSILLLRYPTDVFVDNLGGLYVAHRDSGGMVTKWAPGASEGVLVAGGNGGGSAPNQLGNLFGGLLVDDTGNVYVSDQNNNRIQKWALGASEGITIAGGNGMGIAANQLDWPYEFDFGPEGNLYINDRFNNRIQVWEPGSSEGYTLLDGGDLNGSSRTQLGAPVSLAFGPNGNLYIGDTGNDRVLELVLLKSGGMIIRKGASEGQIIVSTAQAPSIVDAKSIILTGNVSMGGTMGSEDEVLISLYDGTPLTMQINASNADGPLLDGTTTDDKSLTVTFTANRATNNFNLEDVTSMGGGFITLSPLSDMIYTGTFQPFIDSDTISINVLNSAFTDTLGNDNDASNQFNWIYDGNDEPIILAFNCTFPENIANGSIVGVIEAMDPDGDVLSYAITSGNENGIFELDSNTGELKVLDNTLLDFELNPTLELMIEVSDGLSTTGATLNINLTDVLNEDDDETTLSISEAAHMIFPNPSNGIINIQMPEFKKATIYTLAGKKVLSSNELRTDISDLGKGVYIIKLEDLNGTSMTTKLVRE